ncbi:baeRF6 domain-containing protein [Vagococcus salmoninarum]|uniref:baeRF6 domain-containing protein n=1 Tax=Vagococcus salmoninarum TaxID=2739 RepID=UPI003F9C70A0
MFVLPRTTVDEVKLTISKSPDLLSILREQPNKMYYLLALEGTSFRLFKIVDKTVAPLKLDADAPTDLVETLGSEKRGGELNFIGQGGSTTFHGHNETSKEKQIDLERYYREINKYLVETIDLTVPIVLMGLPKNLALFKRISEKLSLSEIQISKSPTDLTNAQIEKTTSNEISEQEVETITDDVAAINNKRVLTDTAEIDQAIDTNQLNKLIVNVGNLSNSVDDHLYNDINRIISRALKINSQVVVLKQEEPQSPALLEATTY